MGGMGGTLGQFASGDVQTGLGQVAGGAGGFFKNMKNPFHNNYSANPYQVTPGSFQNPYFTGGAGQAGSNENLTGIANTGAGTASTGTAGEVGLAANLGQLASGAPGTSIAQRQLAQNTSTNIAAAMAQAAQARGGNAGEAGYQGATAAGTANAGAAAEAATAGIQERMAAAQAQGQVLGNLSNQGLQQQEFGTAADIQQQQAALQASENQQNLQAQQSLGTQQINAGVAGQNTATAGQVAGSLANAAGGAGATALTALLAQGGEVPGPDTGMDSRLVGLRGNELVVPPEDPSYQAIKAHLAARTSTAQHHATRGSRIVEGMRARA